LEAEAVLTFFRSLKSTRQSGQEETILYDEESHQAYRIRVTVEPVPGYLQQSYTARYGLNTTAMALPRRVFRRWKQARGASA
jgi:hypothetical protein